MRALFLIALVSAGCGAPLEQFKTGSLSLYYGTGVDDRLSLSAATGCPALDATAEFNGFQLEADGPALGHHQGWRDRHARPPE
jgi:hypothetical protein